MRSSSFAFDRDPEGPHRTMALSRATTSPNPDSPTEHGLPQGIAGLDHAPGDDSIGISRRTALAGLAAGLPVLAGPALDGLTVPVGRRVTTTGRPISALTGMLGVCMVTSTASGVWGQHDKILKVLKGVGASWIRSEIYAGNRGQITWLNQLAASGIRTNMIMQDPAMKNATPEQLVALIASSMPNACHSMEGANEWNLQGGANWVSELRTHQRRLWKAAKANPVTRSRPVVGPSLGMRKGFTEFGNQSAYMDWGNIHLYTGGYVPGYRTDSLISDERKVCGAKPIILTETGWHNAKNYKGTHNYTPEDVAGTYAPRLMLEYFIRNTPKLSLFELIDEPSDPGMSDHEAHFGLVRNNWAPKPVFAALANMSQIMNRRYRTTRDAGARAGTLSFTIKSGPSDLRSALVFRPDGRYQLFLWRGVAIYDPDKRIYLNPKAAPVTIEWHASRSVRRFAPASSAGALETKVTSVSTLSLAGELQILEIAAA